MKSQKEISKLLSKRFSEDQIGKGGKQIWKSEIVDIEFISPLKILKAVITSAENEVSIFFEDSSSKSDWHTHMEMYGTKEIPEQVEKALELINGLITGNLKIVESSKFGYWISREEDEDFNLADKDEQVSWVKWENL